MLALLCDEGSGGALVHIDFLTFFFGRGGRIITHLIGVGKAGIGVEAFSIFYWLVGSFLFYAENFPCVCVCVCVQTRGTV